MKTKTGVSGMDSKGKKKKQQDFKRVVIVSDLHCGHRTGLTPRQYQQRGGEFYSQQAIMWDFYTEAMDALKKEHPIDILVCNGDAIDGKAPKQGGRDIFEADRKGQVAIAKECLEYSEAKEYRIAFGTPYHVGADEDFEAFLAGELDGKAEGHIFFKVYDTTFDIMHKIGGSSAYTSRSTAITKEILNNMVKSIYKEQALANIIIRSHIHGYKYVGDDMFLGVVTPGLQGYGSIYPVRQCNSIMINVGFIYFDIYPDGSFNWGAKIMKAEVTVDARGNFKTRLVKCI